MGSIVFSDSYTVSGVGYKSFKVRLSYSEDYDAATNKTRVTITGVELKMEDNAVNWGQLPFFGSVKVAGTTLLRMNGGSSVRVSVDGDGYNAVAIPASDTVEIAHNDDGGKSVDFTLAGGLNGYFAASYNGKAFGVSSVSRTVALTSHARASSISSYPSTVATQDSFALSVARNSTAFRHKASFRIGGTTLAVSAAFASSLRYTVPRAWFASYPQDVSLNVTVSVQTYTDSSCATAVGAAAEAQFTVTADAGMKPTLSPGWVTLAPYNVGAAAGLSGYIKGYSRAQASFHPEKITLAANSPGATIASYSVACQGAEGGTSPYLTPVLSSVSASVVCTVTDSRGRSAAESFTLPVMDYAKPTLSGVEVFRCLSNGEASEIGTSYSVRATVSCSPLGGQNSAPLVSAIAPSGSPYGEDTQLNGGEVSVLGAISAEQSYTVRLSATDALGNTAVYYATIPTRKWAMKFRSNGRGVAFGKAAEHDDTFEVSSDWAVRLGQPLDLASGGTGAASAADARSNLGAAAAPTVYVDDASLNSTAEKEYTVSGNGTVIVFCGSYSDSTSDYGSWQAEIYYDGTLIMGEGTRWGSALSLSFGASTAAPISVTSGKKIKIFVRNTKLGTKTVYRRFLCFGCTVS